MAKCAIYCRVSSDEQTEKGTVESQVEYAKKYLELHGPENNITEFEFYIDEGVSGTIPLVDRPAGARLIADAKDGKFKILFMYRLDRLARSVKHVLDTYELLDSKNIALKSMTEAFDTSSPTGKFFMTLLASIAALERDTIMERTLLGKERNAKAGKWVSGPAPFGYKIGEEGKLLIVEKEADTVRLIFRLYSEGMSMIKIAKYLNATGIETPSMAKGMKNKSSGRWGAGHISLMLNAEVYAGVANYLKGSKLKKETIDINVPVIIEPDVFINTQQIVRSNSYNARGKRGRTYLLRGVIFCGHCGKAMVGSSGSGRAKGAYYRCTGTTDYGHGKVCTTRMLKAPDVENAIWTDIFEMIEHPEYFQGYIDEQIKTNKKIEAPVTSELLNVEETILMKQKARGTILALVTRGTITDNEAEGELKDLASEIKILNSRKEYLFSQQGKAKELEANVINSQIVLDIVSKRKDDLTDEDKAKIIDGLVERIEVTTVNGENRKKSSIVKTKYHLGRCVELSVLSESQLYTTFYNIESTWEFQAFSKVGGRRIKWQ